MNYIAFPFNNQLRWMMPIVFLLAGTFFLNSCKKPDFIEYNKGDAPLMLSSEKSSFKLKQKEDGGDALKLMWTSGTNKGTNASISYILKIDKQGNNFANAIVQDLGVAVFEKNFTVKSLNNLLLSQLMVSPDKEASIEFQIISHVSEKMAGSDSSNILAIKVTPYKPVTANLYLIGDATPNGWNSDLATAMVPDPVRSGAFSWEGNLSSGNLKLITTPGQFLPSYNKGAGPDQLVYRDSDGQPDNQFLISTPGSYKITLNLLDLTIKIDASTKPPYTRLWILGDAIPSGWNIDTPDEMRVDSSNLFVFKYNEILSAGEFKIPTATGDFGTDYYMPLVDKQDITGTGMQLVYKGNPDFKWKITTPGPYKISLDLQKMKIDIKPFTPYTKMWMVGDATPAGWNIDNPQPMVADPTDPYIFTYTGPMVAGEFKFPVTTGNWGGDFFMQEVNHQELGSRRVKFVPGGNPDNKWQITTPGNYKIIFNQ
ncbi:MAG: SusF/SusE family outer membrane protein, partial [Ginsengibacter sp.]